ncbi:MarR family winged helix-turn-helix transcriptional regulator [Robertkochia sediminum]|uniref:MarR family winged helix-turn-helix transcriptional regulator n=1 Tax=Robertkochia sediminum TaxID=2785326 RepID=UPI001933E2E7|nr:MarR family transcriptional regulator [Robertkochia sediminum]MBL7471613.1 MarR family transcriptional regulator [Robertkochia sediminum]
MKIEDLIQSENLPEGRRTVISIIYTANMLSEESAAVLKPFKLTLPQFNVLRILRGRKGKPANLSSIQKRMVNKMSNTTRIVDKLIEKGLAERTICPENRRKVEITITKAGLSLLAKIDEPMDSVNREAIAGLTPDEVQTINNLLEKIRS